MLGELHTLFIGINNYPMPNQLNGCLSDVNKIENYFSQLDTSSYQKINDSILLLNEDATKESIVKNIREVIKKINDNDTLFIYYSGHGAEQLNDGMFIDDFNGLQQCLVCYHEDEDDSNYLLADKELRYLLNSCKKKAHIITVFDCCHSGEITRSFNNERKAKRIANHYPKRDIKDFIFHNEVEIEKFANTAFKTVFPDANIISLSASLSNEFSWEDEQGGVFTRTLLDVLRRANGFINYNELIRQCKITISKTTQLKQTPTISVQGDRKLNQLTSWLRLNGDELRESANYITYNKKRGWILTKGKLSNVNVGDYITIKINNNQKKKLKVLKVSLTESLIENPIEEGITLDTKKVYQILSNLELLKPKLSIQNLDHNNVVYNNLKKHLIENESITFTDDLIECDYQVTIFNELVYLSFSGESFKPLHEQFDLMPYDNEKKIDWKELESNINTLCKWHHLKQLTIYDDFYSIPIKVEFKKKEESNWIDITQGNIKLNPFQRTNNNAELFCEYDIKVSNLSKDKIYITVLALFNSLLKISAYPFDNRTLMLGPSRYQIFSNLIVLDNYQEVYNWDCEKVMFKFIVNNHSDITTHISSMIQNGFSEPIIYPKIRRGLRGGGPNIIYENTHKNAIYSSEIILNNTTINQITGTLSSNTDWYLKNEIVQPFIERLYFDYNPNSLLPRLDAKPNNSTEEIRIKGGNLKMNIGNLIDYARRNRKFKKFRKKFPHKSIIVAEGDSWFLYPILVKDTIDYIMEDWPVKSLAWAGDTLENYKKSGDLLKSVEKYNPKYVLISGGGNDIIGSEIKEILIKDVKNAESPSDYLNSKFPLKMQKLGEYYTYFFEELSKSESLSKILVHGYDYIRTDHAKIVTKDGWLNKHMEKMGINDSHERDLLIKFLIDKFNTILKDISKKFNKVVYLDMRGIINSDEWYDEIHPNDLGYRKVADKFLSEIK